MKRAALVVLVASFWAVGTLGGAAVLTREFAYELQPAEESRVWDVNVPLPADESGRFVGREFKTTVSTTGFEFQVVRESLTPTNYQVTVRLFRTTAAQTNVSPRALLQITLQTGQTPLEDTPKCPAGLVWHLDQVKELEWVGWSANKPSADSPRYLAYSLKDGETSQILVEEVVPVYQRGPKIPLFWKVPPNKTCVLTLQASNVSGVLSVPVIGRLMIPGHWGWREGEQAK